MKLKKVHVTEFKSIWDSNEFETDRVVCLVGKNEAGKTSILQALYRLNPIIPDDGNFEVTDDYPRSEAEDYAQDVESETRKPAIVIKATFTLDDDEVAIIEEDLGPGVLERPELVLSKGYAQDADGDSTRFVLIPLVEATLIKNLLGKHEVSETVRAALLNAKTLSQVADYLERSAQASAAESEPEKALRERVAELREAKSLILYVWRTWLEDAVPKFLYFDDYYQMHGHDNVQALKERQSSGTLEKSDHPLLGLIELARLDLDKLLKPGRTQDLKNKLQGASNHLTKQVLRYWSQNRHLRMTFDVRPALEGDPPGMQTGTNIWGEVEDTKRLASTGLGARSAGFVWFFSFLSWYSAVKKRGQSLVLLLDEPGLSLHGRAQEDLLRFFEEEILSTPTHQLIYTTHSPFMVDPSAFDRVRIVQDRSIDSDDDLPREEQGTKVFTDVLAASPDSLFPLQGALGYDFHQTLFSGPNTLVVEGVSDLFYLETVSAILSAAGRVGLDSRWTVTPIGGASKVPTFVSLLGAQKNLSIATLIDFQKADPRGIENLYKTKLLSKSRVLAYADFTGTPEADVEDMFGEEFYVRLVAEEFAIELAAKDLESEQVRVVAKLEEHFKTNLLPDGVHFNRLRPARYLAESAGNLSLPADAVDRFERAFKALNALLS